MAEIKTGIFAKNVQKRLSRAQEKVLQKLGKADETKDEQFEQCVQNFKRQESEGSRLQREMKAYLAAVKGMQQASMNLTESLHEVYEPDWYGKDDVMTVGKNCDALWEDFHQRLVDSSLITLDTYLAQFPDIKNRVAKRSRKLIDYDSARHHLETLQASAMKNDRKISKAEEEFHKAQKVFDDLNVDLQEELPKLWDSRVGFYVNTFKNVTHLESKFHREISLLCRKLYEVMNKLGEQHSDKMFTIQGAPSDSGPLRFARTPTPPEDESPPASPEASPNHMLAPGPHRPRSPSQGRPPVPPPPKVTPTTEMQQEQIISLFDDSFAPDAGAAPPVQNEKAVDSLLDLDFDPFKPDAATPIGQTQSPISQTLPWDLWTAPAAEATQPGAGEWAADFSSPAATAELETTDTDQARSQEWPPADGWGAEPVQPQEETAAAEVSNNAFNGISQPDVGASAPSEDSNEGVAMPEAEAAAPAAESEAALEPAPEPGQAEEAPAAAEAGDTAETSPPAETAADVAEAEAKEGVVSPDTEPAEIPPPADGEKAPADEAAPETAPAGEPEKGSPSAEAPAPEMDVKESPKEQTPEKMPIPSVVIEPASSNEGDDECDGDITSPTAASDNAVTPDSQTATPGMPLGFIYKVETLHDFEAANSDELDLKKGDVVLVVPTELLEDQDAGWLTGIKESDWLQQGDMAQKGLFPENFTQRLE
ncbi:amphiphysin isoform X2 [Megalops cyprinoides]|uniref:amphiphysin isoform X2 n=1 Tax=Megalops cyprinoides TaxID=118141 RepID=UPI00186522AA|nr:amphiphysin isoform X2 [Megalops cyprinoides]